MKMWLKLLLFVYLAIFALLGVSCRGNAGPNIIGTWQAEQGDPPLNNLITGIQFLIDDPRVGRSHGHGLAPVRNSQFRVLEPDPICLQP